MIEGKPRCAALTCLCTIPFVYNASAYTENLPLLSYYILNLLWPGDMSPSYWQIMVSPTKLRCTAVCVAILCPHCLEWWRAACSVPGHHPSLWWYTVDCIPDGILRISSEWQQSSCENALKCRLQTVNSLLRPQCVIVMSSDIRVYECDYQNPHNHGNIIVWTVCFFNLDVKLGRWGRRGDCQIDDGVPVVVNSTVIGAAPGALAVAAGDYPFKWNIYRVIITCLALYIYFFSLNGCLHDVRDASFVFWQLFAWHMVLIR